MSFRVLNAMQKLKKETNYYAYLRTVNVLQPLKILINVKIKPLNYFQKHLFDKQVNIKKNTGSLSYHF